MRVAHVINRLVPGGAELQLQGLVGRTEQDHLIIELARSENSSRAAAVWTLRRRLRESAPDAVVAWLDRSQLAVTVAGPRSVPRVAAVRGVPGRADRMRSRLLRLALGSYDSLVVNSRESQTAVESFLGRRGQPPIHVIPNGVEAVEVDERRRRGAGPLRLAFIGRDDPAKGLDVLFGALALLDPGEVEATLVGAGVPDAAAKRPLSVKVHAFPRVDDPWAVVEGCDALVISSRTEGSPNVVLEAFARRLPVVGTAAGGTASLLGHGRGLLVPVGDPAALAGAIRGLAGDPQAADRRADAAYRYVREAHAWPRIVTAWEQLLAGIAESRHR